MIVRKYSVPQLFANRKWQFAALALAAMTAGAMETVDLNGLWDFRFERGKSLEEVALPAFEANDKMTVPGCWNAYSHYFNQHGTGCYRRTFELAEASADAFLVVDGVGLLKATVFGVVICTVSCHQGFTTRMGAVGVGRATQRSVIISFLLILMLGYMITRMFYLEF